MCVNVQTLLIYPKCFPMGGKTKWTATAISILNPCFIHNYRLRSITGPAVKYSTIDTRSNCIPPPRLNEHTQEVLQRLLGYSTERIQKLHSDGTIGLLKE